MSVPSWCSVPYRLFLVSEVSVSCIMPLLHSWSSPCGQFLLWSTISLGPEFCEDFYRVPCHYCMTGHLPAGGSQLPSGSTVSSAQFLWLLALPCSCLPAPMPLLLFFDRFHYGIFLRDLLLF
jgi:hypothetical protein